MIKFWRLSKSTRDNAPGFLFTYSVSSDGHEVKKNEMSNIYSFSEKIIEFKRNLTSLKAATFQDLCLFLYLNLKILINWRESHQIIVTRLRPIEKLIILYVTTPFWKHLNFKLSHITSLWNMILIEEANNETNRYWSKALEATRVTSTCRLKSVTFVRSKAMLEFWI